MSPKKALLILSPFIALLILSFIMVALGQFNLTKNAAVENSGAHRKIEASTDGQAEIDEVETVINDKIGEKMKQIENKPSGQPFSQDEIDFLVNPRQTALDEVVTETQDSTASDKPPLE